MLYNIMSEYFNKYIKYKNKYNNIGGGYPERDRRPPILPSYPGNRVPPSLNPISGTPSLSMPVHLFNPPSRLFTDVSPPTVEYIQLPTPEELLNEQFGLLRLIRNLLSRNNLNISDDEQHRIFILLEIILLNIIDQRDLLNSENRINDIRILYDNNILILNSIQEKLDSYNVITIQGYDLNTIIQEILYLQNDFYNLLVQQLIQQPRQFDNPIQISPEIQSRNRIIPRPPETPRTNSTRPRPRQIPRPRSIPPETLRPDEIIIPRPPETPRTNIRPRPRPLEIPRPNRVRPNIII